jgi:hypothetical protein
MRSPIALILILLLGPLTFVIANGIYHREYYMDKVFKDKFDFSEALKALKNGNTIHRNSEYPTKYTSREIIEDGVSRREYGFRRGDGTFTSRIYLDDKDILAEDWIIEEKK